MFENLKNMIPGFTKYNLLNMNSNFGALNFQNICITQYLHNFKANDNNRVESLILKEK